jgi:AcrR family transcriptional regulator
MRADARKNYDLLLAVARDLVTEQGADVSLRDVARTAGVGLGTLYRHFPNREALLDALLRESFDGLTAQAAVLERSRSPEDALVTWVRDCVALTHEIRGVVALMVAAMEDPESALHASCHALRAAGARLLISAQEAGAARIDVDGADLFALVSALAWLNDQPAVAPRADHLFDVVAGAILSDRASSSPAERP